MQIVKKQHYVPRFYLKQWCITGKKQVYIYDKVKKEKRCSNIEDVACEGHFYDLDMNDYYPAEEIETMNASGITVDGWLQTIEKGLSSNIENPSSFLFAKLIPKAKNATARETRECHFISDELKKELSLYLSFQFFRTKAIREDILASSNRIGEHCRKMGIPEEKIEEIILTKKQASKIHIKMLFEEEKIKNAAYLFYSKIWMLGQNKTKKKLFTSDNPIGMKDHDKEKPKFLGTGLATLGVELFYPLSPDLLLIMLDSDYHKSYKMLDRRYVQMNELNVDHYNSLLYWHATRNIISCDGDFTLIDKIDKMK